MFTDAQPRPGAFKSKVSATRPDFSGASERANACWKIQAVSFSTCACRVYKKSITALR